MAIKSAVIVHLSQQEIIMPKENVPLTILSGTRNSLINLDGQTFPWPTPHPDYTYQLIVLSRKDLDIVVNEISSDYKAVPASVKKYDGNRDYLLLVSTHALTSNMYPQGDFYDFLMRNGAGAELVKGVQVCQAIGKEFNFFNYCLVSVMGTKEGRDVYSINQNIPLPLPMRLLLLAEEYTPESDF